jgi:hypothetical protein
MAVSKNIVFALMLGLCGLGARCQNNGVITKVEFTSLTRGYQKEVFIAADSLTKIVNNRGEIKVIKRKLADGEWEEILKAAGDIQLSEMNDLPSPSSKRAFDGARHSTITLYTNQGGRWTHSFDDEVPHEKLQQLMEAIKEIAGTEADQ